MSELDEADQKLLMELLNDFPTFARDCLRIKDKTGQINPFNLNRGQRYLHQKLEEQRAKTGKVRALLLKGRQGGYSTYAGGRFYHRTSTTPGVQTYILTHEQEATNNLFGMVERFHKHNPLAPSTGASNAKELIFDRLDSGYSVGTAGTKATGRSKTIQLFHGSEVAFWPNAGAHFAGVVQAVPDLPGTEIILESTANGMGNEFHERWQKAEAGVGDYAAIFCPWFWSDEYRRDPGAGFVCDPEESEYKHLYNLDDQQIAWRRAKLAELNDPLLFKQEYPATAAEAFQTTGHDSYIPSELVLKARKAKVEATGPLIIGVDPKREGTDRFSIAWRRGRKLEKVESDASPITNTVAAAKLKTILDRDLPARMFIDAGGGGGIYDILCDWGYGDKVRLVNFGSAPIYPPRIDKDGKKMAGPKNRRAEMWMLSKEWLQGEGGADIPDLDSLQTDACAPGYSYDITTQQLVLESKEHMRLVRKIRSPDEWDAVALTFAEPVNPNAKSWPVPDTKWIV